MTSRQSITRPRDNAVLNRDKRRETAISLSKALREAQKHANRISQDLKAVKLTISKIGDDILTQELTLVDPPMEQIHYTPETISNSAPGHSSFYNSDYTTMTFNTQANAIYCYNKMFNTQNRLNKRKSNVAPKKFLTKGLNPTREQLYKKWDIVSGPNNNVARLIPIRKNTDIDNTSPRWCLYWRNSQQPPRRKHNIVLEVSDL